MTWNDFDGGGVAIFARDTTTGKLTQPAGTDGCATRRRERGRRRTPARTCAAADTRTRSRSRRTASTPTCRTTTRTASRSSISTRRRGRSRSRAGTAGCISDDGTSEDGAATCQDTGVLNGAWHAAVSPDGKTLFVLATASADYLTPAMASYRIDAVSGALTRAGGHGPLHLERRQQRRGRGYMPGRPRPGEPRGHHSQRGRPVAVRDELSRSTDDGGVAVLRGRSRRPGKLTSSRARRAASRRTGRASTAQTRCTDINCGRRFVQARALAGPGVRLPPERRPAGTRASITQFSRQAPPVCGNVTDGDGVPDAVRAGAAVQRSQR